MAREHIVEYTTAASQASNDGISEVLPQQQQGAKEMPSMTEEISTSPKGTNFLPKTLAAATAGAIFLAAAVSMGK